MSTRSPNSWPTPRYVAEGAPIRDSVLRWAGGPASAAGFGVTLALGSAMSGWHGRLAATVGLAVMGLVVAIFGCIAESLAAAATAVSAWLMLDGFVVDRYGVLAWHGDSDVLRLAVLACCACIPAVVRTAHGQRQHRPRRTINPGGISPR
ncbi:MAG: hypothetical protein ACRDPG_13980 [Nocardioidaceae bacterium]